MSREILVHIAPGETQAAIIQDGHLDDFHLEVGHHQSILGNIYKGRVESILPSINGAFVNIGQEKNGFLYLTDVVAPQTADEPSGPMKIIKKIFNRKDKKDPAEAAKVVPLKQGQEILVQVVKEPFSTKGARLTSHISLAGRFVVYMPYDDHGGVSKKIESHDERQRLRGVLDGFDFVTTGGMLTLHGTLNIPAISGFGTPTLGNTWRIMTSAGGIADNGITLGTTPALSGNLTFELDFSSGENVFLTVVPEAGTAGLVALGTLLLRALRRRG